MIEVSNLEFSYPTSSTKAIDSLSFNINKGEILGFLGPSGAGKSTTQKVLTGLLKDYKGSVKIDGEELRTLGTDFAERIGVCFEHSTHFLKLTGLENLKYFQKLYHNQSRDLESLLSKVGLGEAKDVLVSRYSKGMKIRLSFARSILHEPEILFLDEPTFGLDPVNTQNILKIIKEYQAKGNTIFITTHNMELADKLADQVAFIVDGRIETIAPPERLKLLHGRKTVKVITDRCESREFELNNLGDNEEFLALLRESTIKTIHSQEADLETVFIEVTGRGLN